MAIEFNDNLHVKVNRPTDFRFGPFVDIAQANSIIPIAQRHHGLIFGIYTNPGDIANSDIIYYCYIDDLSDSSYRLLFITKAPIDGEYANQAAMFAAQSNQTEDYIYFDGEFFWQYLGTTNGNITDYRIFGGISENFVSLTFSQLQALIGASDLTPGTFYLVNDFQTIHQIINTSTINTGPVEPIFSIATSTTALSSGARSTVYLKDSIEIDWTNILCEDGITPRKGLITYRFDTSRNVDTYFDFRAWKIRRWQFNGFDHETGFVATTPTNITLTLTWSPNMNGSYLTVYRKWEIKFPAGLTHDAGAINLTITKGAFSYTRPLLSCYSMLNNWTANQLAGLVGPIVYSPLLDSFILMNLYDIGNPQSGYFIARASTAYTVGNGLRVLPGVSFNDYLTFYTSYDTGNINNVHLGPGCTNNFFIGLVYNFSLGGYSSNNTFVGQIATSTIGGESNNNLILGGFNWSDVGGEFLSNVIGWDANYFSIEGYSINNNLLPGGFNFNAPYTFFWNSTAYCFGWGYKFTGDSIEGSFIALNGTTRSDVLFDKKVISSIVGYIANADSLSFRKVLTSKYIHARPFTTDLFYSVNIEATPTPVGTITIIGLDSNNDLVKTAYTTTNIDIPPIEESYASQAAMIADQGDQLMDYIYYDGAQYWHYLGTTTGTIADYREFNSSYPTYSIIDLGNVSGTFTVDLSLGRKFKMVQIANATMDYSNLELGAEYTFQITRDANYTFSFTAGKYRFPLGSPILLTNPLNNGSSPASSTDVLTGQSLELNRLDLVITPDLMNN